MEQCSIHEDYYCVYAQSEVTCSTSFSNNTQLSVKARALCMCRRVLGLIELCRVVYMYTCK